MLGHNGAGTLEHFWIKQERVPLLIGGFGKAFGLFGAFVARSDALIRDDLQTAESAIYYCPSSGLAAAASTATAIDSHGELAPPARIEPIDRSFSNVPEMSMDCLFHWSAPHSRPLVVGTTTCAWKLPKSCWMRVLGVCYSSTWFPRQCPLTHQSVGGA
ncbi:MAG: hypothetical protein ACYYK0_01030 [Candidatus Eutrophobiaceae bacterium]